VAWIRAHPGAILEGAHFHHAVLHAALALKALRGDIGALVACRAAHVLALIGRDVLQVAPLIADVACFPLARTSADVPALGTILVRVEAPVHALLAEAPGARIACQIGWREPAVLVLKRLLIRGDRATLEPKVLAPRPTFALIADAVEVLEWVHPFILQ